MFDLKISQIIDFKLNIDSISIQFHKEYESEPSNPQTISDDKSSLIYR